MILDTNAVSAMADRHPALLKIVGGADALALSFATVAEFYYGLLGSSRPGAGIELIRRLEGALPVLFPDAGTIRHYAWIAEHLKRKGRAIPHNDIWTASLARQHALPILSLDRRFDYIDGIQRLGW